ncbi:MAG: flavin reductase family protein [Chloroflexota bacterium]|nr:flavin reductase family protein [Chloroflexota bacterium]
MSKKLVEGSAGFHHHFPRLVIIVTCHARGKDNAMAVAWHSSVSQKPPLIGVSISPKRYTYELILEAREFGVNFISLEKAELIAATGGCPGKAVDKFRRFNLEKEPMLKTKAPILKDAYAAYECKLVENQTYGDHEWFVGEIVATHFDETAFTAAGILDLAAVNPAMFIGGELYYTTQQKSERHLERSKYGNGLG